MGTMDGWRDFFGPNAGYVAELYERFLRDPSSVDVATRALFSAWQPPTEAPGAPASAVTIGSGSPSAVAAANLAQAIRDLGHLDAHLDPLGSPPHGDPALRLETHGLDEKALAELPASAVGGPAAVGAANAREAIERLRRLYSAGSGYEFAHAHDAGERAWLREAVESGRYAPPLEPDEARGLLERLTAVESLERYLNRTYPGQTRFSIEGLDVLVPMLDRAIAGAAEAGICEVILAMAHRGRLNVLANVLGKPYAQILAEFDGPAQRGAGAPADGSQVGWTGDVKYHIGGRHAVREGNSVSLVVTLPSNPSHLEFIDPVAEGMARASDEGRNRPGAPVFYPNAALPILIHGDAAFSGQGIVAETLGFSGLPGYQTAGTLHIVANNQLGFTATPQETRSTLYASDLAKGFEIPIVHVNADDPEACLAAVSLASAYRQQFHKDFLIDLVGYRRYGHNEGDDPTFTQPTMYDSISRHPSVREQWAQRLVAAGLVGDAEVEQLAQGVQERLRLAKETPEEKQDAPRRRSSARPATPPPETAVPGETLRRLNDELCRLPQGFTPSPRLSRVLQRRCAAPQAGGKIDWGQAETLAFASLLADGTPIRLSGQDTARGTFSQRHLVLFDQRSGLPYVPLQNLPSARAAFAVYNSPLSENAALGFEYGYSAHAPRTLVLWEAQYGDFANGGQVIIDQFIASGRAKWSSRSSLVLLLPHGFEGQGPEHSSARLERFLSLAADDNLRLANCTTAAQYFHLLRLQAAHMDDDARPLVVMTPKSLLRLPEAAATLDELARGTFQPLIDDAAAQTRPGDITRLLLCSGKVYYDLVGSEARAATSGVAVVRLESLYPFPAGDLTRLFAAYPNLREVIWVQEEPENMGAWPYVAPLLRELTPEPLAYVGRPPRSSPAEGSPAWHAAEQARIVTAAFGETARPREMLRGAGHAG
jgi:2-oxoglutarate dehydrogenase E1 component